MLRVSPKQLPVTVAVTGFTSVLFVCGLLSPFTKELFAMIPANSVLSHNYLWNIITSGFFEDNPFKFIFFLALIVPALSRFETQRQNPAVVGGSLLAIGTASGATVFLVRVLLYYFLGESFLFTGNYGLAGLLVTVTIGLLHCNENEMGPFNTQIRQLVLPGLILYSIIAVSTGVINDLAYSLLAFPYSLVVFGKLTPLAVTGLDSTIDVATFVPERFQPLARAFLLVLRTVFAKCLPISTQAATPSMSEKSVVDSEMGEATVDPVAERRRARALKALDEKLAEISKQPEISLDGDEED